MATFQRDQIRHVYQTRYPGIFGTTNNNLVHFIADEIADLKILVDTSTQGGPNAQGNPNAQDGPNAQNDPNAQGGPVAVLGDATAPGEEVPLLARGLRGRWLQRCLNLTSNVDGMTEWHVYCGV